MLSYLEHSRFAIADISGLNFNIAYQLGARHRLRGTGTAIFRQTDTLVPFDISSVKAFAYEYTTEQQVADSRALISRVLTESLARNLTDSPIALSLQQKSGSRDYSKVCYVNMPFGRKLVGGRAIDFDAIYRDVFAPAISAVTLPAGGTLQPHRSDQDFVTGDIKQESFEHLEYSRVVVTDISGLNFNVAYQFGARQRARETLTAVLRQTGAPVPFDLSAIKVFPYDHEPSQKAAESRALITRILTELLRRDESSPKTVSIQADPRPAAE
jgi:hypothetical protein